MRISRITGLLLLLLGSPVLGAEAPSDEAAEAPDEAPGGPAADAEECATLFERLRVVSEPVKRIPGSVAYVAEEELRRQNQSDLHRILRLVPGVHVQEEDGYGLRPNIGMRGSGSERSSKITLLEDGVLVAPAPYSAPAAYYVPTAGRMEGIEVRKGSGSIQHGPYTNGGVLNLMSSRIPSGLGGGVQLALGPDDTLRGRARVGSSSPRFGWLVESYRFDTDGFKRLDGGGSTGVELQDYLVKLRATTAGGSSTFQAVELKLGKTLQHGNETYLGLTEEDVRATPFRRYAASQRDRIDSDHQQFQLNYLVRPSATFDLTATVYRNDFFRNWRKLQKVDGVDIGDVLADPGGFADRLALLRADVDGGPDSLTLRNNRRDYYSQGVQALLGIHARSGAARHEIEIGLRLHQDAEDRFQEEDGFAMQSGRMTQTSGGAPGSHSNRIDSARAWAAYARDTISIGDWTFSPGLRVEWIDYERRNFGRDDPQRTGVDLTRTENDVSVVIPGFGVSYQATPATTWFAGVHRGFAPPGPGADRQTRPEESVNFELGWRRQHGPLSAEAIAFFNDYDNLLGADTLASGGSGEGNLFNGGEVRVHGMEALFGYDVGAAANLRLSLPLRFSYTFTAARFRNTFETEFEGWGDLVHAGDRLPYLPAHQATLTLGLVDTRWSAFVDVAYTAAMRTTAGRGPLGPGEGTDAHLLLDLTVNHHLRERLKLFVQLRNLTDEIYVAARRPAGARPGLPRTVLAGVTWDF